MGPRLASWGMVDAYKLGEIGWSVGGCGAMKLANTRSEDRAILPKDP